MIAVLFLFTITFAYTIYLGFCGHKVDGYSYFLAMAMFFVSFAAMEIAVWY